MLLVREKSGRSALTHEEEVGGAGVPIQSGERRLRLAFVCAGDPLNVRTWSGTPYHMLSALKRHSDVVEVVRKPWSAPADFTRRVVRRLSRGRWDLFWLVSQSRIASIPTIRRLVRADCDAVIAVAIAPLAAHLGSEKPTVYISDATFRVMEDYNAGFQKLSAACKRGGRELERLAIRRALLVSFPSHWARSSALEHFGADAERTFQIAWGANFDADAVVPVGDGETRPFRLLFVGVDWYGKGGDVALATLSQLRSRGHDVELDIVGCMPSDPPPKIDGVTFHGFISKLTEEGRSHLRDLYRRAHLLLFPTRFEALGIVVSESASFGVPTVSYRTGGVPSNVIDGVTGILIDEGGPASAFVEAIESLMNDPDKYRAMSQEALALSQQRLNWDSWASALITVLRRQLAQADA